MDKGIVGGECTRYRLGAQVTERSAKGADDGGTHHRNPIGAIEALKLACAEVVAHYGLHSLAYAYHYHHQQLREGGENAHGCHCRVAAIAVERIIDYGIYHTACHIHEERSCANRHDCHENVRIEAVDAALEVQLTLGGIEVRHHENHRYCHGNIGGYGSALYAPAEHEDEYRGKNHIHSGSDKHGHHRLGGVARGSHYVVEGVAQIGGKQSGHYVEHKVAGIGQRAFTRAECQQNRVHKCCKHREICHTEYQRHHQAVAKNLESKRLVVLPQHYRDARGSTAANEHTKSSGEVHHRESDGKSGDGVGTHTLTDKDAVDYVVERHHHNAHNGRNTVFP